MNAHLIHVVVSGAPRATDGDARDGHDENTAKAILRDLRGLKTCWSSLAERVIAT
jgi:hypothetical protein